MKKINNAEKNLSKYLYFLGVGLGETLFIALNFLDELVFKPKYIITPKTNKTLAEIERVRGFWDAVVQSMT